jgi:hypothetical protein
MTYEAADKPKHRSSDINLKFNRAYIMMLKKKLPMVSDGIFPKFIPISKISHHIYKVEKSSLFYISAQSCT